MIGIEMEFTCKYLNTEQLIEKYPFITKSMLKNTLDKDFNGFREKCVRKLGKRILIDEIKFLKYLSELPTEK